MNCLVEFKMKRESSNDPDPNSVKERRRKERERKRLKRSNPQFREAENKTRATARAKQRSDPLFVQLEQQRNTEAHALSRSDPVYRQLEQQRNTTAHTIRRNDSVIRQQEQQRNTTAHASHRKYQTWAQKWNTWLDAKCDGPMITCFSCDKLFFKKQVIETSQEKLIESGFEINFLKNGIKDEYFNNTPWTFCRICYRNFRKGTYGKLNIKQSWLAFPEIDPNISILEPLEQRLIAARIPFMKIRALGCDRQFGIHGGVVNVQIDVPKMFESIPIDPRHSEVIHLKLKRKMSYQRHYLYERIRPKAVYEAAEVLCQSSLYQQLGINLDNNWVHKDKGDEVDFDTDVDQGNK